MVVSRHQGTAVDYLIVLLLVLMSGNDVLVGGTYADWISVAVFGMLLGGYILSKSPPLYVTDVLVFSILFVILAIQGISFAFLPLVTVAGFAIRLFIAFFAVRSAENFPRIYVDVLVAICLVSLLFYVPEQIFAAVGKDLGLVFESVVSYQQNVSGQCCAQHIGIYNFEDQSEVHANAGLFWESGAFAGYILLAMCFLGLTRENYHGRAYKIRLAVLVVTLLTCASTTGYLTAPVALATHYRRNRQPIARQLGAIALGIGMLPVFLFGVYKMWEQEVIGGKIAMQYEKAVSESGRWQINRFGTLLYDWQYIRERPLLGWGIHEKTVWAKTPQDAYLASGMGNGLTWFIRRFGFIGLAIFLFFTWRGFYQLSNGRLFGAGAALATVLLALFGQNYLRYPLFLGLFFLFNAGTKVRPSSKAPEQARFDRIAPAGPEPIATGPKWRSESIDKMPRYKRQETRGYSAAP